MSGFFPKIKLQSALMSDTQLLDQLRTGQDGLKRLFEQQRALVDHFFANVDHSSVQKLLDLILNCKGVVFFSGVGKSGIVAEKIAMTMVSTGTRAFCIPPTNALHGDLGVVGEGDIVVFMSKSGESDELISLVPYVRNKGAIPIALVSNQQSRLEKACDDSVYLPLERELCPFDLAPTTSAAIQLLFGDVLAVALMEAKNFSLGDYASNHPAGRIGKRITLTVTDLMLKGDALPLAGQDDLLGDSLVELSNKRCGTLLIVDDQMRLLGIFTDGDLRRALQGRGGEVLGTPLGELMTRTPRSVAPGLLAYEAIKVMESDQKRAITVLPVVESDRVVGLIKMHDLVQSGLV